MILRALLLTFAVTAFGANAQQFDSFDQSTLPPLPEQGEGQESDGGLIELPWLDGQGTVRPGSDDGVILNTNPGGQSGVVLEMFPGVSGPATSVSQAVTRQGERITLRALDRMLGRPADIELTVGQTVLFGRIAIHVPECRYPAEDPSSDAFAHVEVLDTGGSTLFDGWMVASSPALSALEHPRYDVWVLRCSSTS